MSGQRCRCGLTREQHSVMRPAGACLACTSCEAGAKPYVMTRCECVEFDSIEETENSEQAPEVAAVADRAPRGRDPRGDRPPAATRHAAAARAAVP